MFSGEDLYPQDIPFGLISNPGSNYNMDPSFVIKTELTEVCDQDYLQLDTVYTFSIVKKINTKIINQLKI